MNIKLHDFNLETEFAIYQDIGEEHGKYQNYTEWRTHIIEKLDSLTQNDRVNFEYYIIREKRKQTKEIARIDSVWMPLNIFILAIFLTFVFSFSDVVCDYNSNKILFYGLSALVTIAIDVLLYKIGKRRREKFSDWEYFFLDILEVIDYSKCQTAEEFVDMNYNKLILVGNGFDIQHGLDTSYKSFVNKNKDNPVIKEFRELAENIDGTSCLFNEDGTGKNIKWYSFEEQMERIANWMFEKNLSEDLELTDYKALDKQMEEYNSLFERLADLLFQYLADEYNSKKKTLVDSIRKEFTKETYAISFNYTDTIKLYTDNYYFVHGSINDDGNIILGFANGMISDLSTGEYAKYWKEVLKEKLNYLRFLKANNYDNIEELLDEFEPHLMSLYSGRGEYDLTETFDGEKSVYDVSDMSAPLHMYAEKNNYSAVRDNMDFSKVKEIVIMGHGLESDQFYIESLINAATSLERIKLFVYDKEKECSIDRKIKRLEEMSGIKEIITVPY